MASRTHQKDGISIRFLLMHPAIWFVAATCGLIYLAIFAWSKHKDRFLDADRFQLTQNRIKLNELPEWANSLAQKRIAEVSSTGESLLDLNLIPAVQDYLQTVPWIRHVQRIEKSSRGLDIAVTCRQPVALLGEDGPVLLDGDGVVFDNEVLEYDRYIQAKNIAIRINMPLLDVRPTIPWHPRQDRRVQHAARLAEFLFPLKQELRIYRVITRTSGDSNIAAPRLELWTANGTRVKWGSAPGHEIEGEIASQQKLAALREFISNYGNLTEFEHRETHAIDVTTGIPVVVKDIRMAQKPNWLDELK